MNKILNKWYFGLIIIPIFINLITNSIGLPDLFNNWIYTIIAILLILVLILIVELYQLNQKYKTLKFTPKQSDQKIILELIDTLDVNLFHEEIKEQNSWYGYKEEAINKAIDFAKKAGLPSYKTSNKELNKLINDLKNAIDDFTIYSGTQLYPNGAKYSPAKDTKHNIERAEKASPIMNEMTDIAFLKLSRLLEYLKARNYFE